MRTDITRLCNDLLDKQMDAVAGEAVRYMKSILPRGKSANHPYSTGHLRNSIRKVQASTGRWYVEAVAISENGENYAWYVDKGRNGFGPVNARRLRFEGKDGKKVVVPYVGPMSGINFTGRTRDYIASKYGGK